MYLLDTNAIIDYLDNKLSEKGILFMDKIELPQISIASRIELSILPNATEKHIKITQQYIDYCKVYDLSETIVLKIIELRRKYKIKDFDSIIAATALVNNLSLVSNDKGFLNIKNLRTINLYEL